jgi:hypothetical protein
MARVHEGAALKRLIAACSVAAVSTAMFLVGPAGLASAAKTVSKPTMVQIASAPRVPTGARLVGAVKSTATIAGSVVLKPRNQAALTQFISAVTNPKSSYFHDYLRPGQYASTFGPTKADIAAVRSQLVAEGLHVSGVSSDGLLVHFTGSAKTVEKAFATGLNSYRLAGGSAGQATTGAIRVPSTIASRVTAVIGLDNLVRPQAVPIRADKTGHPAAAAPRTSAVPGAPSACADATAAAQEFGGLTDDQIANAYGAFGLYSAGDLGAGQRIGVFELEPFEKSDIQTFDTCFFGATAAAQMMSRLHVISIDGGQPAGYGSGEAILDVEDVSALAPGAQIDVYEAPGFSPDYIVNQYAAMVDTDQDQVITTSWGVCEQAMQTSLPGTQQAENLVFEQAAAQGQSVFAAAGDTGDDSCNEDRLPEPPPGQPTLSVLDPASQPYVTAVGGTTINDATDPPQEQVWNDGAEWGAGGGGISQSWTMPSWQRAATVPGMVLPGSADYTIGNAVEAATGSKTGFCQTAVTGATSSTPCRTLPDVSAQADEFTGAVTIYSASFVSSETPTGWSTIGGTSSSTPIWASLLADINASPTCQANPATKNGVGFASPLLYAVASNPTDYAASFNDITTGNNDIYGLDNGNVFPATKGYDLASGLGSPQVTDPGGKAGLAYYLCSLASSPAKPAVTKLSPAAVPVKGGTVVITGSGFKTGSTSDVASIQVGAAQVAKGKFTVKSATEIVATVPPALDARSPAAPKPLDGAGPANVIVSLANGVSSSPTAASRLQYVDESKKGSVPSVTSVGPSGGSETSPKPLTIYGSGFTGATKVTFGGVRARTFKVVNPFEITAVPAVYSKSVKCATTIKHETPTTDICQVQVQVTNSHGSSATGKILPPLEGTLPEVYNAMGFPETPAGCHCEIEPGSTEFDYVPAPVITSVSTTAANPYSLASEYGGTLITLKGRGLDYLSTNWTDFGPPDQSGSEDFSIVYETGTQIQVEANGAAASVDTETVPVSVDSVAGQSNAKSVVYAGTPNVTAVATTSGGADGAADTGGTPLTITGQGFSQTVQPIIFADASTGYSVGTQYQYKVNSDTSLSTETVQENEGLVDVEVCSVTGCSYNPPDDEFILYPPGNPVVTAVTPDSGAAAGGNTVTITGQNLGCATAVYFGTVAAVTFSNTQALLDCGSTDSVTVTVPAGTAGATVPVIVDTVESALTGATPTSSATYTYTS